MNFICRRSASFAAASMLAAVTVGTSHAQTVPSVVIVVDGSGSMWGELPGGKGSKFKTSTTALQETLEGLSPKPNVGIVAFGQRPSAGCNAVKIHLEVQAYEPKLFTDAIGQINPKGRGPLVDGVYAAAEILSKSAPPRNIFIVHDDPDNCNKDICAAVAELKRRFSDLKIYALTLAPQQGDKDAMACIAKTTGGRVIEAANASEAAAGIDLIMADIDAASGERQVAGFQDGPGQAKGLNLPLKSQRAVPNSPGLMLQALLTKNGAVLQDGLIWKIASLANNTEKVVGRTTESEPSIALAPGRYAVILRSTGLLRRQEIDVAPGRRTVVPFHLESAAIMVAAVLPPDGSRVVDANFTISKIGGSGAENVVWSGLAPQVPLIVEPGEYKLTVSAGHVSQSHAFAASPGEQIDLSVPLKASYLNIKTANLGPATLGAATLGVATANSNAIVSVQNDDLNRPSGRRLVARSIKANPSFLLAPGTYYAKLEGAPPLDEQLVTIVPGQPIERMLTATRMRLRLVSRFQGSGTIINERLSYRIRSTENNDMPAQTSFSAAPEFNLAPGHYRLEARFGKQNAAIVRNFEITPSPAGRIVLDIDAATVALKTAQLNPNTFWEIRDEANKTVWRTVEAQPVLTLKSGRYKIIAEVEDRMLTRDIAIESGRHIDIEIN